MSFDTTPGRSRSTQQPVLPPDFIALATTVLGTIMVIATVTVLYFLREVFIPLALAILLSFVLAPAMRLLQRIHIPRGPAAVIVVLLAFGVISVLGTIMVTGVRDLAADLPRYQSVLRDKVQAVKGMTAGSKTLDQASSILQDLSKELQASNPERSKSAPAAPQGEPSIPATPEKPVPVIIRQQESGTLATITSLITPLISPLATMGVIIVFVIFMLVKRQDLRDRTIRLTGTRDLGRTTAAIDDAARRLSKFYVTQVLLNSSFGIAVGIGLWLIGVPNAPTWGILAAVLRFVPYVGALISAVLPMSLAAAIEPGWTKVIECAVMFGVIEVLVGQVIEPLLYGRSTGLSPVAVVVSATFWTWLWGPIGLVLATPLTMCLVVLGRHVERMRFLEIMFGNRPALSPPEIFYQRMLASDPAEAADHAGQFLKKRSLLTYYESVALHGLQLAQADIAAGLLDRDKTATLVASANEVLEDLATEDITLLSGGLRGVDNETAAALASNPEAEVPPLPHLTPEDAREGWEEGAVVCIAGASDLDFVVARILAQVLDRHGQPTQCLPASALRSADLFRLDLSRARWIALSYMGQTSPAHVRQTIKKLRRKAPNAAVAICAWSATADEAAGLGATVDASKILRSLHDAAKDALTAATGEGSIQAKAIGETIPAQDPQRASELQAAG